MSHRVHCGSSIHHRQQVSSTAMISLMTLVHAHIAGHNERRQAHVVEGCKDKVSSLVPRADCWKQKHLPTLRRMQSDSQYRYAKRFNVQCRCQSCAGPTKLAVHQAGQDHQCKVCAGQIDNHVSLQGSIAGEAEWAGHHANDPRNIDEGAIEHAARQHGRGGTVEAPSDDQNACNAAPGSKPCCPALLCCSPQIAC